LTDIKNYKTIKCTDMSDDDDDRSEFIRLNLNALISKTTLTGELVTSLYSAGLITRTEEQKMVRVKILKLKLKCTKSKIFILLEKWHVRC